MITSLAPRVVQRRVRRVIVRLACDPARTRPEKGAAGPPLDGRSAEASGLRVDAAGDTVHPPVPFCHVGDRGALVSWAGYTGRSRKPFTALSGPGEDV